MNDPMFEGGEAAARMNYHHADECFRETRLALAETSAVAICNSENRSAFEKARALIDAARHHRKAAAIALNDSNESANGFNTPAQRAVASSRLTVQAAVWSLIALAGFDVAHRANNVLNLYLPPQSGPQRLYIDRQGDLQASNCCRIFGSNRNGPTPPRPRQVALMDIAINTLTQRTRNPDFAQRHARHFCDRFLEEAATGSILPDDDINQWINERMPGQQLTGCKGEIATIDASPTVCQTS